MICTEYSCLATDELISFAESSTGRTTLERELAMRLQLAVDMIDDARSCYGEHTRGACQGAD